MTHSDFAASAVPVLQAAPAIGAAETGVDALAPVRSAITELGFRVACYAIPVTSVPADFFADPDGQWTLEALAQAAGFSVQQGVAVGALREPFNGHPDGAAVVTLNAESRPYVAIIECPIAFVYAEPAFERVSAA
jgi:hypothetical protein